MNEGVSGIDGPRNSTVRDEDALCQRGSVVGAIRTRCVDLVAYLGQ